jgi:cysteine desulfurase
MLNKEDKEIYLDYAANTPIDKEVFSYMAPFFDMSFGNPSSLHMRGRRSRKIIEDARKSIASSIGSDSGEIIFMGSGTEANNVAIIGIARANKNKGNHIIISAIEHKSVIEAAHVLEKEGFVVSVLPVKKNGIIDVQECIQLITEKTILISVMYVNNEIGTIQPIKELAEEISKRKNNNLPLLHVDACQAITMLPVDVKNLGVDLLTLNSSKVYGPNGVGLLYKKNGVNIEPLIMGGGQENNLRAGTESVPLIAGFAKALQISIEKRDAEHIRLTSLQKYLREGLESKIPQLFFNGDQEMSVPSIVNITIPGVEGESMLMMLDNYGICVSTGSACSASDLHPSYVLIAIGQSPEIIHGSLRISMGRFTTQEDIDYFLEIFPKVVERLRGMSPVGV